MITNNIKTWSIALLGALTAAACADLDTESEGEYMTESQVNETNEAIQSRSDAVVSGMYKIIGTPNLVLAADRADDGGAPTVYLSQDLNGPDMVCINSGYNWFNVSSDYSDRNTTYANLIMRYALFYNQIKAANDIIASYDSTSVDESTVYIIAQARAVRAFDYLSLAPYFQFSYATSKDSLCVPLVTEQTTDYANNPRATVAEVYSLIMSDLDYAVEHLDGFTRTDKIYIDQSVAYGLRARANLYMGNYAEAADDAEQAMAGYSPYTMDELQEPILYDRSAEPGAHAWMWGLDMDATTANRFSYATSGGQLNSFSSDSYTAGVGCYKDINSLLYNVIPSTDVRKQWWVSDKLQSNILNNITWTTSDGKSYTGKDIATLEISNVKVAFNPYTNVKFGMKSGIGASVNDNDYCLMRVEEMILIEAEGLAMSGQEGKAKQVLESFVKTYRNPSYSCPASSSSELQTEVWKQRRIELWGEGFAMSDIMRLRKPVVRFHGTDTGNWPDAYCFNIAPDDGYLLLRIPQRETNANSAIVNNSGGKAPESMQNPDLTDGVTD